MSEKERFMFWFGALAGASFGMAISVCWRIIYG